MADTSKSFDELNKQQGLKAAVHYTTGRICQEVAADQNKKFNRQVVAVITEAAWKKCEQFAFDLELFAKHAKRNTINSEDVMLLVRKSPKLLKHISELNDQLIAKKGDAKKKVRKPKSTSVTVTEVEGDNSRS
ncbi:hypothetical protein CHS0354_004989 [Potamilus streckersoni]|uniref:Centromere protein S n=1 Tax=Potamilus streckersoni TaxID=2493646 RepID=A0AAE0ST77_9BIVA|nr:hypothetical protein CHS0354_004989 [Potamilus streckersoni]